MLSSKDSLVRLRLRMLHAAFSKSTHDRRFYELEGVNESVYCF